MEGCKFRKSERLVSSKVIGELFSSGSRSFSCFPVKAVYRKAAVSDGHPPVKVLTSVSKRHFKHAVDRNRAKRQIREAYRLHKDILPEVLHDKQTHLSIAFIWMSDTPQPTNRVAASVERLLRIISERL